MSNQLFMGVKENQEKNIKENKKSVWVIFSVCVLTGFLFFPGINKAEAGNCGGATTCVCGDTVTSNYTLPGDLSCTGNGLVAGASDITIDGNSHSITGDGGSGEYGISGVLGNVIVKNITLTNFYYGISVSSVSGCTIQNVTINSSYFGVVFGDASNNSLTGSTFYNNQYALDLSGSNSNTFTGNTINSNAYAIWLTGSGSNTFTGNTIDSNAYAIYLNVSNSNTFSNNIVSNNVTGLYLKTSTNTYSSNQFLHNPISKMLTFVDTSARTKNVNDTVSFDFSMFTASGSACSSCSYSITTSPSETVTSTVAVNRVTGSFTATKSGIYSLITSVSDTTNNTTTKIMLFFVGNTSSQTVRYYYRGIQPTHYGNIAGTINDTQSLLFTAPTSTEIGLCDAWVQASPDEKPNYPFSNLSSIDTYAWYKHTKVAGGYIGVERSVTYGQGTNLSSSTPAVGLTEILLI
jgi:parallel beta-helix repeat protein